MNYYDGIKDLAEVDLQEANRLLRLGWKVMKIVEKQQENSATLIVYIMAK